MIHVVKMMKLYLKELILIVVIVLHQEDVNVYVKKEVLHSKIMDLGDFMVIIVYMVEKTVEMDMKESIVKMMNILYHAIYRYMYLQLLRDILFLLY